MKRILSVILTLLIIVTLFIAPNKFFIVASGNDSTKNYNSAKGTLTVPVGVYNVKETQSEFDYTYYISASGTNSNTGTSEDKPLYSFTQVVTKINDSGISNAKVKVVVLGGEGIVAGSNITSDDAATLANFQNWPWPAKYCDNVDFVITSKDPSNSATIRCDQGVNIGAYGNTVFKDVNILYTWLDGQSVYNAGYDLEFNNVKFFFCNGNSFGTVYTRNSTYPLNVYSGGTEDNGLFYQATDTTLATDGVLTIDSAATYQTFSFGGSGNNPSKATATINGDAGIVVNGGTVGKLYLQRTGYATTFKGNLNLVLNNGTALNNIYVSENLRYVPVIEGAIQIVANNGAIIPDMDDVIEYATNNSIPLFIMDSSSQSKGLIETTEVTGSFVIDSDYKYAYAYDSNSLYYGEEILKVKDPGSYMVNYANSIDEIIETVPGTWNDNGDGTMSNASRVAYYYVKYGGSGNGLSAETPLATVDDAVKAAKATGYSEGDVVYINVIQSDDWNWGAGTIGAGGNYRADEHHITTWAARGALTSHKFTIVVQSKNGTNAYLASNCQLGLNLDMVLGGPTIFKRITIVRMRRWRGLFANGYDVVYGEGTRFGCVNSDDCASEFTAWNGTVVVEDEVNTTVSLGNVNKLSDGGGGTIEFNNFHVNGVVVGVVISSISDIWVNGTATGPTDDTEKYANDVRIVYDNPRLTSNISWGNISGGSSLFEKNLNINIKSAKEIGYTKGGGAVTVNGGVQIISASKIDGITEIPDNVTVKGGKWFIQNNGISDLVDFTENAGIFTVKNGCGVVATNVETNQKFSSSKDYLTLPEGQYIITEADIDDGVIDTNDLVSLKKFLLNAQESVGSFADYHYDNVIDIRDLVALKKHLAGIKAINSGFASEEASVLRKEILNAKNTKENYNITGTKYYVSENGSSWSSGKYESIPTTISKVSKLSLKEGDAVLFERGSLFRIDKTIEMKSGVTYGSYGTGDKPKFYASPKSLVGSSVWSATEKDNVWKTKYNYSEVGSVVFNHGEKVGYRKNSLAEIKKDYDFYHDEENGMLYLCFNGKNPGSQFESIEASIKVIIFQIPHNSKNVIVDNLCMKYSAWGAINMYYVTNVHITNCEMGYIGGTSYDENVRMGNAIGNWGGTNGWYIENNWIYQTFDSAISPQGQINYEDTHYYENIYIRNNLLEYNNADFEYWCDTPHTLKNFVMEDNICRFTSLGWGTRIDDGGYRGIEGVLVMTSKDVEAANINFKNNIIDCPGREIIRWDYYVGFENALSMTENRVYVNKNYRTTDIIIRNQFQQNFCAVDLKTIKSSFSVFPDFGDIYWYR